MCWRGGSISNTSVVCETHVLCSECACLAVGWPPAKLLLPSSLDPTELLQYINLEKIYS